MKTFPTGVTIKPIVTYQNAAADTITVSKRSGGIGANVYLVAGTGGFTATRKTLDKATEAALGELVRLTREAEKKSDALHNQG